MSDLDVDALHAAATDSADGLAEFGEPSYRAGLDVLLAAAQRSPAAGPGLHAQVAGLATRTLVGRLHSEAGWRRQPDFADARIEAPLIVIGLPRSGTTALHQLLSADDQFQWIPQWLADTPAPRPPRREWPLDERYRAAQERRAQQGINPLHDVSPDDPQECLNVMVQSFVSMMFVSSLPVPEYHEWFLAQDERPSFSRFVDNLRLMADGDSRPWLLKNPSHVFGLDALLDVIPDARIVWIHRDPVESIPSGCSLILKNGGSGAGFTPTELGRHRLRIWSIAAQRGEAARTQAAPGQIHDVDYRRFVSDPEGAVRDIYQHFGLSLSEPAADALRRWVGDNPPDKHGRHAYSPADFGLDDQEIRHAFGDYLARIH